MKIFQNSGVPIYQQISEQFKEEILAGKLKQGEYLPSIRSLAKDLKISVITTMKAYEQLEAEGLVTGVQGKGFYVPYGGKVSADNSLTRQFYVRGDKDAWLEANTAECWNGAVVTKPVAVNEMHKWLKAHPGTFLAALPNE